MHMQQVSRHWIRRFIIFHIRIIVFLSVFFIVVVITYYMYVGRVKKVCLCKWRFTCVPWTTHTTWNLNMQENNLNKCHARNKFDNELVINHPRCKTNKIPIMIDMWMYIIWRFYQLVNNLQFTLSFNDNTIESLAMPPCRVCYVFKNHIIYE
jgi:hypothetical protein